MPFTILSDNNVKSILSSLSKEKVLDLADILQTTLTQHSTPSESPHQPHRAVVTRDQQTTLFMPATTPSHSGVKIVGISPPGAANASLKPGLQASLTLCDSEGRAVGVLNAAEMTAFRTALGSMLLYRQRRQTGNVVVFGAGAQARWHVRLALLLRGDETRRVTVVNRSRLRAEELVARLRAAGAVPAHVALEVFDEREAQREALRERVQEAHVLFTAVPSATPLFPAEWLMSDKARPRGRYIAAIGSYRLDMQELDPELLREMAAPSGLFQEVVWKGKVAVDSAEACLVEAGELVKAGIGREGMLEVGRIAEMRAGGSPQEGLEEWLADGFVVYKSVGVGAMDIAIGSQLLELAGEKGVGVRLEDF
ncbi:hypothetical protein G6514_005825 [Epicoccum nigrum]|nr:hypothetical protein G6514_005825 [Epicoccum nigrum]